MMLTVAMALPKSPKTVKNGGLGYLQARFVRNENPCCSFFLEVLGHWGFRYKAKSNYPADLQPFAFPTRLHDSWEAGQAW